VSADDEEVFTFRPIGITVRDGLVALSISWPLPRSIRIQRDGIALSQIKIATWIDRDAVTHIEKLPGAVRIEWLSDGNVARATVVDWFRANRTVRALRRAGYRLDGDFPIPDGRA
jgi:hypothetical protein